MKKLFSVIFVGFLLLPTVAWLIDFDVGLQAERTGFQRPAFNPRALFENAYYQSFDQYFNDSFSLRSPLLVKKRWIDYRLFRMTDTASVHIGINGWLYNRRSIEDHLKNACSHETDVAWKVLELHALEKIIHASGRRFFFLVVPNKATIYPEFVGFFPQDLACNSSRLDLLLDTITTYPLASFVRLDTLLREAKAEDALLYDRTGTCWNGQGAVVAAEEVRQRMFEDPAKEMRLDLRPLAADGRSDLIRQMMGIALSDEDEPGGHFAVSGRPDLPTGIVYGDDCIRNLLPYVKQLFSQLDVIQTARVPSKQHGENLQAHDVILIAKTESELSELYIDLDQIFSIFENAAPLAVRHPLDLQTVVPIENISLSVGERGLQIKSVGAQSVFEFRSIQASDDTIFRVLKLTIESPHNDIMTIKYMSGLPYITSKSLKPGLEEVYLPLPYQKLLSLRMYPGKKAGVFQIHSTAILEFSDTPAFEQSQQETTIASVRQPEEKPAVIQFEAEAGLPKSEPGIRISDTAADGMDQENKTEIEVPEDAEVPQSSDIFEEMTRPANKHPIVTEEFQASDPATKTEAGNSIPGMGSSNESLPSEDNTPEIAAVPILTPSSIAVADFADGCIFQRKGRSADIVVSGSYSGSLDAIEARVVLDKTFEEVVPWTIIDASPRNGIFVGTIPEVPQGGWYNLHVRSAKDHAVSARGVHKWGVGILVACLGQSNMKEWFYTGRDLTAHSLLRKFTDMGWSEIGRNGNAAIAFGNRITEQLGIPIGLLDYSKNGSGLRKEADWGTGYWEDTTPGSIYDRFLAGVSQAGGALEFVIWIQGEADAARGTVTEEEYRTSLESFITNQVRADIDNGSDKRNLPFLIVMMIKRPGGKDETHQAIRSAQKNVAEEVADCYLAATTLDLKNQGRQHLSPAAYILLGRRVAQTVLYVLGEDSYHRGPWVTEVMQIDSHTIEISITHRGGTNFAPASRISGWEVLVDGKSVPIAQAYRQDSQTIRIVLESPLTEKAMIRYLYGAMPDASRPVMDNSAMSLPLEEFQSEIN